MQRLSVSIVVYDLDVPMLQRCLGSLKSAADQAIEAGALGQWSLTVIDNGDNSPAVEQLLPPCTRLIRNADNIGFGPAHNQGIRAAHSDLHLVLNPDVILAADSIIRAAGFFNSTPDAVACGPLGTDDAHNNLYLCKRYPAVLDLFLRGFMPAFINSLFDERLGRYEYRDLPVDAPAQVTLLSGCCLFARTSSLRETGGFDERYFLYFEDYDLSLRLADHGRVMFVPDIRIIHHGGNSARKGTGHIARFCHSAFRFYRANGWKIF